MSGAVLLLLGGLLIGAGLGRVDVWAIASGAILVVAGWRI